ncbi:MAG: serine/threonine protein kinase [Caldilinea sp.]|nr:serine/threonine protein kinase [Caldilinea sp.]
MAAVYQAQDLNLPGRIVAVKEMSNASSGDPTMYRQAVAAFQQEAKLLIALSHPHIVRVSDFIVEGNKYYLVMDFVDGASLEDLLAQRGQAFDEQKVLAWLSQLCDALAYLHSRTPPIIFRDLKPSNIMVDRSGSIMLIDFGIARRFDPMQSRDTTALGTAGYAPPEQHGKGQTDARSDIYALGVTAHRLLTGYDPSSTPFQLPPVQRLNPSISVTTAELITYCVQNDIASRPQRMADVQRVVTNQLGRIPAGAMLPSGPAVQQSTRPTTRFVQAIAQLSSKQLVIGIGALVAVMVFGILLLGPWLRTNFPFLWYEIPAFLIVGPIAYAAARRIGAAFVAQSATTMIVWCVIWLRFDMWPSPSMFSEFLLGLLLSALVYEFSFYWLDKQTAWSSSGALWKREVMWYGTTTDIAAFCFFMAWNSRNLFSLLLWIGAFALGAGGWFIGDSVRQEVLRRAGSTHP